MAIYGDLLKLRDDAANNAPVFVSQKGGRLDASQVHRIVRAAAQRASIDGNVSPHWLRHAHASHALDRGASIALVRDTLGHSSLAVTSRYTHAKPGDSNAHGNDICRASGIGDAGDSRTVLLAGN